MKRQFIRIAKAGQGKLTALDPRLSNRSRRMSQAAMVSASGNGFHPKRKNRDAVPKSRRA
jgi:hypothetical protein